MALLEIEGCGKSVTAMSILRLVPDRFQGKDLLKFSERESAAFAATRSA
jgi:ABC-type dipeptide/oligopeptide/nickel transport system ATPase component